MQKLKEYRKLAVIALLASVLTAVPFAIRTYATNNNSSTPVITGSPAPSSSPAPTANPTPTTNPVQPQVITAVEPTETPTAPEQTPVDIVAAINIAKAAHDQAAGKSSDVIRAQVQLKSLNGEKVFKVVFADGWRIYVRASNGEIVLMKDASNKAHKYGSQGEDAVAAWQNAFQKKWGFQPTRHYSDDPKQQDQDSAWWDGHGWKKQNQQFGQQQPSNGQPQQQNEQQPVETEEAAEQ